MYLRFNDGQSQNGNLPSSRQMASSVLHLYVAWPWNSHALEYVHHSQIRKFEAFLLNFLGTKNVCLFQYFVDFKLDTNSTMVGSAGVEDTSVFDGFNYATNFMPFIGFASQIPNVIFNWLNIFVNMGYVSLACRLVIMLSICFLQIQMQSFSFSCSD